MGHTDNPATTEVRVPESNYRGRNPQVQSEHAQLSTNPNVSGTLQLMAEVAHQEAYLAPIRPPVPPRPPPRPPLRPPIRPRSRRHTAAAGVVRIQAILADRKHLHPPSLSHADR